MSVKEILKNSTGAGVTGAVSAGAAYSAVAAFGAASTGTLISSISGIAASNATLAWLGGGALAAGGGGMALGAIVLGGIAIVPAVSYFIWKGKFDYAEEREEVDKKYTEAIEYSSSMDGIIKNFTELNRLVENTISLMNRYSIECNKLNKQTNHIKNKIGNDYEKYTEEQMVLVKKHITYITGLLKLINTPIMKEDGSFNNEMIAILKVSDQFLKDANIIEFVSYKKQLSVWTYILPAVVLISIGGYIYYEFYYKVIQ
jgi:flagellar basal body-associated protein FliL